MAYGAFFSPEQERRWRGLDELESKITELWGYLNTATYRFLTLVAEFDREKAYERHGLANTAQWQGLESVEVMGRGNLSSAVAAELGQRVITAD